MRRFLTIGLITGLLTAAGAVGAQMMPVGSFVQGAPTDACGSGAYIGPGDCTPYTAWYGLRAYSAAVAATGTQKAIDLRRVSDNATCTALIGTNGNIDLTVGTPCNSNTQTVTAWIGASSAKVTKAYDQTNGNHCGGASCDVVQATTANQLSFFLTGCGGSGALPCMQVGPSQGAGKLQSAASFTPSSTNESYSAVGETISPGTTSIFFLKASDHLLFDMAGAGNWACDGLGGTAADNAWHVTNCAQKTGANATTNNIDGTEFIGTTSPSLTAGAVKLLDPIGTSGTFQLGEAGFADDTTWSSTLRAALCHNQRAYWGTAGTC